MIAVLVGLLALTAATLALARVDMDATVNIWLAIGVAVAQAFLVTLYFMRLRWDSLFNGVVLIAAVFFVAIFIGIAVLDTKEYHPDLSPSSGVAPQP
jgi:cytochrome c oxidase subunit 4